MPVLFTDSNRFSGVVKYEFDPASAYCRESIVVNDVAQTLKVGTVLGVVTGTGKYKVSLSTASDGSQTPAAIYVADYRGLSTDYPIAANTDASAIIIKRGPAIISDAGLVLGSGITAAAVKAALLLATPPILVEVGL